MKLSVVTVSFNQARFLQDAIDSVDCSASHQVQHVIVDPGSTDGSRQIIERNRRRFSPILLDPDRGPADGLNNGFDHCEGEVLGYLNADDRYPPGALDAVARYFETNPEKDILFGCIAIIDREGRRSLRGRIPDRLDLRKYAERACNVWCPSTFFRHKAFMKSGGFNVANRTCWDGELAVDFALSGANAGYSDRVLGEFRSYKDSLTGSRRMWSQYREDRQRIRQKIYNAGSHPYSKFVAGALRLHYKLDPIRHASYLC